MSARIQKCATIIAYEHEYELYVRLCVCVWLWLLCRNVVFGDCNNHIICGYQWNDDDGIPDGEMFPCNWHEWIAFLWSVWTFSVTQCFPGALRLVRQLFFFLHFILFHFFSIVLDLVYDVYAVSQWKCCCLLVSVQYFCSFWMPYRISNTSHMKVPKWRCCAHFIYSHHHPLFTRMPSRNWRWQNTQKKTYSTQHTHTHTENLSHTTASSQVSIVLLFEDNLIW